MYNFKLILSFVLYMCWEVFSKEKAFKVFSGYRYNITAFGIEIMLSRLECAKNCLFLTECASFDFRKIDNHLVSCGFFTTFTVNIANLLPDENYSYAVNEEFAQGFNCSQLYAMNHHVDGVYSVALGNGEMIDVFCELNETRSDGSGHGEWTVIQRRLDNSTNFYRPWAEYEQGFGDLSGNFWFGLEHIAALTSEGGVELIVFLETFDNDFAYAYYEHFQVADREDNYRMNVSGYGGTAGDALNYSNGQQFTTYDRDNDLFWANCAVSFTGAWWYNNCHRANLNGLYHFGYQTVFAKGITWKQYRGQYYSLKAVYMKIR